MIKKLLIELKNTSFSVLPIYFLIMLLILFKVFTLNGNEILSFSYATVLVIIGIALFNFGAENAMTPIGKIVGKGLTKQGKTWILLLAVFLFGLCITVAEPDLSVLALQTSSIFPKYLLITSIGISVGLFLLIAILRIIKKVNLIRVLSTLYMFAFSLVAILSYQEKEQMVALAFDSGGVTTGPMTVPFLMALGAGVASIIAMKSEKDASFGFVAFSSIGPVIVMLLMSLFTKGSIDYTLPDYSLSDNFFLSYLWYLFEKLKDVGVAIGILLFCYLVIDVILIHSSKRRLFKLIKGMLIAYIGLVIFLAAVDSTYMGIGFKIGTELSETHKGLIIIIAFVVGMVTVIAEPAIKILITQVEEITNGIIKRKSMLIALALGVGIAISLAMIRIIFKFSILYIIIPGYLVCFVLSFFVPKIYTAIAFDAGGVASGPLTSSFILPIAIGLCSSLNGADEILSYGFGVVSLVALSPLLSIEILGVCSVIINKKKIKKEIKKALKKDDKVLISFGE